MVLQASLIHTLALFQDHLVPNLLLILLVFVALYCDPRDVITAAFSIGLSADIIGPTMGPHTLAFGVIGSLLGELRRYLVVERIIYQGLTVTATGILATLLAALLSSFKGQGMGLSLLPVVGGPLYSALLAPLLFPLLHLVFGTQRRYRRLLLF